MTTIFVPSVRKKNGTGHVKRCLLLAEALKREGEEIFFYLDVPTEEGEILKKQFPPLNDYPLFFKTQNLPEGLDRIILDNRQTSYEEFIRWESLAPVILLDEGGKPVPSDLFSSILCPTLKGRSQILREVLFFLPGAVR